MKTVKDLIDLAKKRPGEILYASSGIGGFPHMNTELFKLMTGVKMVHVPFKGGGPATADVVAGHTPAAVRLAGHGHAARAERPAQADRDRRPRSAIPSYPNVPTIAETVPGYESQHLVGHLRAAEDARRTSSRASTPRPWR